MNKSKIKLGLLTLLMSSSLLVGCNQGPNIGPEPKPHEHSLSVVEAKEATYYNKGNIKYYYCPECGKKFSDSGGKVEVSDDDVIINKKTILEETTEAKKEDVEIVLQNAVVDGKKQFVSLKHDEVDVTGLYVTSDKKDDYTTISFNFSEAVNDITYFSFDYRFLENCGDRQYDMLGHDFLTKKLNKEKEEHTFIPHSSDLLNKDCDWHTFEYKEPNNLDGEIISLKLNIYRFDGEIVINNVYVIHHVDGTSGEDVPSTVAHYEDLEGGKYYYDYENDEYIPVRDEDVQISKRDGKKPSCEEAGYKEYYFCEYTKEYYEDKDGKKIIEDIDKWKAKGGDGYLEPTHTLEEVPGVEPTCTAAGYKSCYKCSKCGKYFEDKKGEKLIGTEADYNTWKNAEGKGKIEAQGHLFGEDGVCTRSGCNETIKNYLGLEDASRSDLMTKISLSGIGISAPDWTALSAHAWGSHDLVANKGIDLTFGVQLDSAATSQSLHVYVGSKGQNETGMKFRFDYNPDTQCYGGYIYGSSDNDLPDAGEENGTKYTIPDFITTEREITARITLIQDSSNPYKFNFALYVNGHKAVAPNPDYPLKDSVTFNGTDPRNIIRFSQTTKSKIKEAQVENPKELIFVNGDTIYGKKTDFTTPINMPNMAREGYKFLGWFDERSNKLSGTVSSIAKKTIVKPLFVKNENNMYVPSDFSWDTKGKEIHPRGEGAKDNPNLSKDATRIDVYTIIKPTLAVEDQYFFIGLPYDFKDGKTRVELRVSLHPTAPFYWHSPTSSIGGASESTAITPSGLNWQSGVNYLFNIYVEESGDIEKPLNFGFKVINLADLSSFSSSIKFKFNDATAASEYKVGDNIRNRLGFRTLDQEIGSTDFSVTDAW